MYISAWVSSCPEHFIHSWLNLLEIQSQSSQRPHCSLGKEHTQGQTISPEFCNITDTLLKCRDISLINTWPSLLWDFTQSELLSSWQNHLSMGVPSPPGQDGSQAAGMTLGK